MAVAASHDRVTNVRASEIALNRALWVALGITLLGRKADYELGAKMTGAWSTSFPASRSISISPAVRAIANAGLTMVVSVGEETVAASRSS
jgi:hypothetical protein